MMAELTSMCGSATSVQYITRDGRGYRLAKSIEKADVLNLNVGGKNATLIKDKSLPVVKDGDEVELTGVINSRSGWLEVVILKNSTSGTEWKFSRMKAVFGI
jgi:hypothetical protein